MVAIIAILVACQSATITLEDERGIEPGDDTADAIDTNDDSDNTPVPGCDDDSDGYTDEDCGGPDCYYDLDADLNTDDGGHIKASDIHPGPTGDRSENETWYDGVDQNCAGDGKDLDYDQNGDEVLSWQYGADLGGTDCDDDDDGRLVNNCNINEADYDEDNEYDDCDDGDPLRTPFNPEDNENGIDDNCLGGVDGFGLTVTWNETVDDESDEWTGTLTFRMTDDYISELHVRVNGETMKVDLRNTSTDGAVFYGEINVVASGEFQGNHTMEITLYGLEPEDVSFLYLSQNGMAALGEYTNDRNTEDDTTDDLQLPVSCTVWGPEADLFTVPVSGPCVDISTPGTAPDGSAYEGIDYDGSGNWTWDGL